MNWEKNRSDIKAELVVQRREVLAVKIAVGLVAVSAIGVYVHYLFFI